MADHAPLSYRLTRLDWTDPDFGAVETGGRSMPIFGGFGSGLSIRPGEEDVVWAICDRGPNLKIETAIARLGLTRLAELSGGSDAKVMPRLDLGPAIAKLRLCGDKVELVRIVRLSSRQGAPLSGLPIPESGHSSCEPALDLDGEAIAPSPDGADSEGIAAIPGGGFWVSDEYGPSLLRLDKEGTVTLRLLPEGVALSGAGYPCRSALPAIAARRRLNRGFEGIAVAPSGKWLFLAFQSPLAHPDDDAHEQARHVRIWRLDPEGGGVAAQYAYPLDPPDSFLRDRAKGDLERKDLKVSEIAALGDDGLLVLERGSETTRIYKVALSPENALPMSHLDEAQRPSLEELSGSDSFSLAELSKELVFDSDQAPQIAADLEGMAVLSTSSLLLVNDNDFGIEGAKTSFWRIDFDVPLLDDEDPSRKGGLS